MNEYSSEIFITIREKLATFKQTASVEVTPLKIQTKRLKEQNSRLLNAF